MKIVCSKCGHGIESLIIDRDLAWKEMFSQLIKHCQRQHPQVVSALNVGVTKVAAAVGIFMSVSELAVVPEEEEYINKHLEEIQELIMMAAGFDPEELEDEEEEEEEEELTPEVLESEDTSEEKPIETSVEPLN